MNNNDKKVPKIRFKGYTDAWEQCRLGDVTDIFDGTHQTPKYTESGVKFVSVENISTLETEKYISHEAYINEYSNKQAEKGDVLMTRIGDIGTAKVIETDESMAYYVTLALLKPKNINSNFLAWLITCPEVQRDIWKRTLHIAFPKKINLGEISQVEISVSSYEEQTRIGSFFQSLDNLITLHQRKLENTQKMKKTLLSSMFPKNNEKVPEIRFKGYADAWEQRNLSDVLTERNVQHSQNKVYPLVSFTVERGVTPKTDRYEREQLVRGDKSAKKYKATELDDIVYNPANLKFGAIARNKYGKAVFSPIYVTLEVNANLALPKYIERIVTKQDFIQYALTYQQGTVYERQSVSPENLLSLSIPLPLIQEQEVIGNFFDLFDNLITLHQRELENLKKIKKTMLKDMFV